MEMWLKQSTLALLTVAAMVISGQHPVAVDEEPRRTHVPPGSSLTLNCSLRTAGYERFRVSWHFNPSGPSLNESRELSKTFNVVKGDAKDTAFKYTLSNASVNNSGWYFCRITTEIPMLEVFNSKGTEVVITKSVEHTTYRSLPVVTSEQATVSPTDNAQLIDLWLWVTLAVSTFILIILLVVCVMVRRRSRRSREADPVYANTRPVANRQPSPRPGTPGDNLKVVSSSQNLRNPSPGRRYDECKRKHRQ